MKSTPVHDHGVMEGKGSYNRYSRIPAGGMSLALPRFQEAVQKVEFDRDEQAVVVDDYGSSQGKNSLAPMRVAIRTLRERLGADRPIFVLHVDQPNNDFNTLFEVLSADSDRYDMDEPNIFPARLEGHSTKVYFRKSTFIWDGARLQLCD